jgi:hypothetical protein
VGEVVLFSIFFVRERNAVVHCVEERFVFLDQGDSFYMLLHGECMMDVGGCACAVRSGNVTVSRKVMIRTVVTVPSGSIMNFND